MVKKYLVLLSALAFFLSGCNSANDIKAQPGLSESSLSKAEVSFDKNELQESQTQNVIIAEIDPALSQILEEDSVEGSVKFFAYLLENFGEAKKACEEKKEAFVSMYSYNRFGHILLVFERDGLSTVNFEFVDYKPVNTKELFGETSETNSYSYGRPIWLYEINVMVKYGGSPRLPEGRNRWLGAFFEGEPYVDFILPYEDAVNRLEADIIFREESARVEEDAHLIQQLFSSPDEIPMETMIFYLLNYSNSDEQFVNDNDYYGYMVTQEEIDARAKKYFGLNHVDGKNTSFYIAEKDLYYMLVWGDGGPITRDVLKIEKCDNATYGYYDFDAYLSDCMFEKEWNKDRYPNGRDDREIIKFTYIGDILQSAEVVDNPGFSSVVLAGENGG